MPRKRENGRLEEALAFLLNSQANLLSQQTDLLSQQTNLFGQLAQLAARTDERFARIENELRAHSNEFAEIKAILLRHEQILQALPEAVRDKIGFKTR